MKLRTFASVGAAAALTVTGLVAAPSAGAAAPGVPASCQVWWQAFSNGGTTYEYSYRSGKAARGPASSNALGWKPTSFQQRGAAGDDSVFQTNNLATSAGGKLIAVKQVSRKSNGWKVTQSTRTLQSSGWSGTRAFALGDRFSYRLVGGTLTRFRLEGGITSVTISDRRTVSTNRSKVRSIVYERTVSAPGTGKVDVLLANDSAGRLVEMRIPHDKPWQWKQTVLKSSGFGSFRTLSTYPCSTAGRAIGGITSDGRMHVYYDAKATDGRGSDIRGGSTGSGGFTLTAFGQ